MMNLKSETIQLRLVEESDAAFILELRLDERYNKFLSSVSPDIDTQRSWIKNYKNDEKDKRQFYFIIERLNGVRCGTVRVYDLRVDSFCWGSWILNEEKTRYAAIESAFLIYQFGFDVLGYKKSHFDVMKGNKGVVSFHEKMGAIKVGEDEQNFYFEATQDDILQAKNKFWERTK